VKALNHHRDSPVDPRPRQILMIELEVFRRLDRTMMSLYTATDSIGAAEYEVLVGRPGEAAGGMDAQSLGHLAIVITVIIGNIGYFASGGKGGKEK